MPPASDGLALPLETLRGRPSRKWTLYPPDVLPAWIADMDFAAPEAVQAAMRKLVDGQNYGYPWTDSDEALLDGFVQRMQTRFGWTVAASQVVPLADLVQGMTLAIMAFSQPGDGVIVQPPIYPPFLNSIDGTSRRRVYNPLIDDGQRFQVDVPGLAKAIDERTRILMLCNPHNPAGRVLRRDELAAIGQVAIERDLIIVADEIHADLLYPGQRHTPIASLSPEIAARTITMTSATKSFNIAGLRCGVLYFGSDQLLERFRAAIPQRALGAVNIAGIEATVAAWRDGAAWLERVLRVLDANRQRVAAWAAEHAPSIRHHTPEGTYLAWLDCAGLGLAQEPRDFFLEHARVGLNRGGDFGPGGETCVRLNFATSPDILEEILGRMSKAIVSR